MRHREDTRKMEGIGPDSSNQKPWLSATLQEAQDLLQHVRNSALRTRLHSIVEQLLRQQGRSGVEGGQVNDIDSSHLTKALRTALAQMPTSDRDECTDQLVLAILFIISNNEILAKQHLTKSRSAVVLSERPAAELVDGLPKAPNGLSILDPTS